MNEQNLENLKFINTLILNMQTILKFLTDIRIKLSNKKELISEEIKMLELLKQQYKI